MTGTSSRTWRSRTGTTNSNPTRPKTFTVGKPHPVQVNAALAREAFTGLGYLEVMPFTLTNEDVLYRRMQRPETKGVLHVMHPISIENTVVRTELLPLLLEFLTLNRHRELPQRLFTVGDVVLDCRTHQQAAGVSTHPDADFSEAYASADAVLHELSIDYTVKESADPAFIDGRRGDIIVAGKTVGSLWRDPSRRADRIRARALRCRVRVRSQSRTGIPRL